MSVSLYLEKIVAWAKHPLSFNWACWLSILLHAVLFALAAGYIRLFEVSSFYSPPIIFDYVFSPVQESGQSQESAEEGTSPNEHNFSAPTESHLEKNDFRDPVSESGNPPLSATEFDEETNDSPVTDEIAQEPVDAAETDLESTDDEPPFPQSINPTLFALDQQKLDPPKKVSAKIAVSPRQKKMIAKKIKRWSEGLDPNKWADSRTQWQDDGRTYSARLRQRVATSETGLDEAVIEISTEEDGYAVSTKMRMQRLAFSNFAQFVDYWDPDVAIHNDELNGRFHANTTINISSSNKVQPKFHGKVTTASYDVRMGGPFPVRDERSIFIGGIETGVKEIHLPKINLPFLSDSTISASQYHILPNETWLNFHADGTYSWWNKTPEKEQKQLLPKMSFYVIGEKNARLHVKGVLHGQVLIYAADRIVIDDDITYARHPELSADANDFLGLVSEKDIEIGHPDVTGPGDLHIHAAVYAKGRFRVPNLRGKDDATLYIYGSLTAGSLSATEPRYATHISFDKRLESRRPPNFPMSDRYELQEWDGAWEVKPRDKME